MRDGLLVVLALAWLLGTWLRIYRQARFYQIEEYMSRRYLAWVWRNPNELLPRRPLLAGLVGITLVTLLQMPRSNHRLGDCHSVGDCVLLPTQSARNQEAACPHRKNEAHSSLCRGSYRSCLCYLALPLSHIALDTPNHAFEVAALGALGMLLYSC